MTKTAIRNLHSDKPIPPRFCDVVIEDGKIFLEKKTDKNAVRKNSLGRMWFTKQKLQNPHKSKLQKLPQTAPNLCIVELKPELSTKPFMGKVGNSGFLFCKTISTSHQLL